MSDLGVELGCKQQIDNYFTQVLSRVWRYLLSDDLITSSLEFREDRSRSCIYEILGVQDLA